MPDISNAELLTAWEQAYRLPDIDKGLLFMNLYAPALGPEECAETSIGNRDAALLLLREKIFGKKLLNTVVCPECESKLEWEGSTRDLLIKHPDLESAKSEYDLEENGYLVRFRLPNSNDISFALERERPEVSDKLIMLRCIIEAWESGRSIQQEKLPESIMEKISLKMEHLDPQANININLKCPECENEWTSQFHILSYLWTEINHWAINMMQDVDSLAREYGWTEEEIFRLSAFRRQTYISIINS
jgi:hypothetical protein